MAKLFQLNFLDRNAAYPHHSHITRIVPYLLVIAAAVLGVILVDSNNLKLVVIVIVGVMGIFVVASPPILLWLSIFGGIVVAGVARLYTPGLQQIRWMVAVTATCLFVHVLLNIASKISADKFRYLSSIVFWSLVFVVLTIVSSILNKTDTNSLIIGLKGYFQSWGILFALALLTWSPKLLNAIPTALIWIALVQLPFVLHQYLFIVPNRVGLGDGIVPVDIVSGTFGGDIFGGGMNAVLSAYLFVALSISLAWWRKGVIQTKLMVVLSVALLTPVFLNEAKISVVYMVVVFFVVYRKDFITRPIRFIGITLGMLVVLVALLTSYTAHIENTKVNTIEDLAKFTYEYNFGKSQTFNDKLSRGGAIEYWAKQHGMQDVVGTLIGHGVGASRIESDRNSVVEFNTINPELGIGRIAIIAVLWDSGVIGLLALCVIFWTAFRTAGRLSNEIDDPRISSLCLGLQGAIAVIFVSLWHKNFFVYQIGYQTILVIVLGYLAYWDKWLGNRRDSISS